MQNITHDLNYDPMFYFVDYILTICSIYGKLAFSVWYTTHHMTSITECRQLWTLTTPARSIVLYANVFTVSSKRLLVFKLSDLGFMRLL